MTASMTTTGDPGRATLRPRRWRISGRPIARTVALWLVVVASVVVVGAAGYVLLLGWSIDDALYMTVITMTTVGFHEIRTLDTLGRTWTGVLAIAGVGIIFGTIGLVAERLATEAVSGRRERQRMADAVSRLTGHFILCGYGRVGRTVARELADARTPFVVVDINPDSVAQAADDGLLVVNGDATRDAVLEEAGIGRARVLITTTDSDANNVYVTLSARALNPGLFIVARSVDEQSSAKLVQAGADRTVSPYSQAGRQIAQVALRPRVADFLDYARSHGEVSFSIEEYEIGEEDPIAGQTVGALIARGIHPLAIAHGPQQFETNPAPERVLVAGDHLIVSGTAEAVGKLRGAGGR
jgi:voltage-gated potassium channel